MEEDERIRRRRPGTLKKVPSQNGFALSRCYSVVYLCVCERERERERQVQNRKEKKERMHEKCMNM